MNLLKRYVLLLVISTLLAFSYAIITTKIPFETLVNWSIFLVPSLLTFNMIIFIAILSETISLLKEIVSFNFYCVFLPLTDQKKVYRLLINLIIEIKPNHLRSVVSRC